MGKIMKKVGILIMTMGMALTGCVSNDLSFDTWEEADEKLYAEINRRYDDEFEFIEADKQDNLGTMNYVLRLKSKKYECQFDPSLNENGVYEDNYAYCVYQADTNQMYDDILKGQDYVLEYSIDLLGSRNKEIYDTSKSFEVFFKEKIIKEKNSGVNFFITIADETPNEKIYEIVRYFVGKLEKRGYDILFSIKIDGIDLNDPNIHSDHVYDANIPATESVNWDRYTDEEIYSELSSKYDNGFLDLEWIDASKE